MNKVIGLVLFVAGLYYGYQQFAGGGLAEVTGSYSDKSFDKQVEGPGLVLVKFGAHWCGPCRMLDEELEHVTGHVKVVKINIDRNRELASKFNVSGIPHMVMFKNGKPVDQRVGFSNASKISDWARQYGSGIDPVRNVSGEAKGIEPNAVKTNPFAT